VLSPGLRLGLTSERPADLRIRCADPVEMPDVVLLATSRADIVRVPAVLWAIALTSSITSGVTFLAGQIVERRQDIHLSRVWRRMDHIHA
jgi:hypothetical protein